MTRYKRTRNRELERRLTRAERVNMNLHVPSSIVKRPGEVSFAHSRLFLRHRCCKLFSSFFFFSFLFLFRPVLFFFFSSSSSSSLPPRPLNK